jgi:antitoxin ParD1/3/4
LRNLLLVGASSAPAAPVNETYFEGLRERVRGTTKVTRKTRRQP